MPQAGARHPQKSTGPVRPDPYPAPVTPVFSAA
jgi:hypothetical protein